MKNLKTVFLVLLILFAIAQIVFSQNITSQTGDVADWENSTNHIILLEIIPKSKQYFSGQDVEINVFSRFSNLTPLKNFPIRIDLTSEQLVYIGIEYTNENGQITIFLNNSTHGNYTLSVSASYQNKTFTNSLSFEVKDIEFDIFTAKEKYYLIEAVVFNITGPPNKNFDFLIIGNKISFSFNLNTDENGTYTLSHVFDIPGNYTCSIDKKSLTLEILETEKIEEKPWISAHLLEKYSLNQTVKILLNGTPNTTFVLEIISPTNVTVFSLIDIIGEYLYALDFFPKTPGEYFLSLRWLDNVIFKSFKVYEEEKIYEVSVVYSEQGNASVGRPVRWKSLVSVKNLIDQKIEIGLSSFKLPENSTFLSILDGGGNTISENSSFLIDIEPKSSNNFTIFYETPSPIKNVFDPEVFGNTWARKVLVSSNSSLVYTNVSVMVEINSNLKNVSLLSNGEDVTESSDYNVKLLDLDADGKTDAIEWIVPILKEAYFEIKGTLEEQANLNVKILLKGKRDVVFDCNNTILSGEGENSYGIALINCVNVTVANCIVKGFEIGVLVKNSVYTTLIQNTVKENENGIVFLNSNENKLVKNDAEGNSYHGVLFYASFDNILIENKISSNFNLLSLENIKKLLAS